MNDNGYPDSSIIPYELTGQVPRKTRAIGNGVKTGVLALLLLLLSAVSGILSTKDAVQQIERRSALRSGSTIAIGEIKRLWTQGRSFVTFHVRYSFVANGEDFAGESKVPDQVVSQIRDSNSLPVRYLPSNPSVNHPADWEWSAGPNWEAFIVPILFAVAGIAMFSIFQRDRKLVAEGVPVVGVVTQCFPKRRAGFRVKYEFCTKDGTSITGSDWSSKTERAGATVCILYSSKNPRRNQIYPSLNFRAIH